MDRNDLQAVLAAFRGLQKTATRLQQLEPTVLALGEAPPEVPPAELIRAATAHAIAAGALSGLLHRLFTPGGVPPTSQLTDSADESAS